MIANKYSNWQTHQMGGIKNSLLDKTIKEGELKAIQYYDISMINE